MAKNPDYPHQEILRLYESLIDEIPNLEEVNLEERSIRFSPLFEFDKNSISFGREQDRFEIITQARLKSK